MHSPARAHTSHSAHPRMCMAAHLYTWALALWSGEVCVLHKNKAARTLRHAYLCCLQGVLLCFKVKRSTVDGVEMMRGYPRVDKYPGVEDWLPPEKWSMSRVFDDMQRWNFADASRAGTHRA
eukprot:6181437-Pleurochrysis_carterae.AAC.1